MKGLLKIIIFLSIGIAAISCGRKINCPDLDQELLAWVPYNNDDTIILTNSDGDSSIHLDINEVIVNHTTFYQTNADCGECDDFISISGTNIRISIFLHENSISILSIILSGLRFNEYEEMTDYTFNGKTFNNALVFNQSGSFLVLAKEYGIVGFIDPDGTLWSIERNDHSIQDPSRIKLYIQECG